MAVRIDIPGIGEVEAQNAASEATLRQILKALGGRTGSITGQGGGSGGNLNTDKANKGLDAVGKTSEKTAGSVGKLGSAAASVAGGLINGLVAAVSGAVGAVTGMATGLLQGKTSIHEFTQNVPGLNIITGIIENQMTMYKELSSVGAGFGNSMFEITQVAGASGLSMQTLAKVIASESEGLRMFGGNVQEGTRRFGRLSKEMRTGNLGRQLLGMGLTTEELNENLISYNELLVSTGRDRYMTDSQVAEGSAKYSLELDKIAKLTGKSRKQIEEEQRAKNTDIRRQVAMSSMTGDQLVQFRNNLSLANKISPEFEAALVDMADGIANDPVTRQLMANSDVFKAFAKDIENMSPERMNNFVKDVGDELGGLAQKFKLGGVDAALSAGGSFGSLLTMGGQLAMAVEATEGSVTKQQTEYDKLTTAIGNSVTTLEALSGASQAFVTNTTAFKEATDAIADLIPSYETATQLFEDNKGTIEKAMNDAWNWMKTDGKKILQDVGDQFKLMWPKLVEFYKYLVDDILPNVKKFAEEFLADPASAFGDISQTVINWGIAAVASLGIAITAALGGGPFVAGITASILGMATTIGATILATVSTALTAATGFIAGALGTALTAVGGALLSLPALIAGAILGAVVAIDFAFFEGALTKSVTTAISDMWTYLKDWFKNSVFNPFNWFGGDDEGATSGGATPKKKEGGSWWNKLNPFSSDDEAEAEKQSQVTPIKPTVPTTPANSSSATELAMLNTNMVQLIELTKKNTTAVKALNGNIMAG